MSKVNFYKELGLSGEEAQAFVAVQDIANASNTLYRQGIEAKALNEIGGDLVNRQAYREAVRKLHELSAIPDPTDITY